MNSSNSSKKQGLDTTITKFPYKLCPENVTMIMQFYVISVKHGSIFSVNILIILTTNIYKVLTNHAIISLVPQCSFNFVL